MGFGNVLAGIWDFGSNLFKTGYNLYTNERDFDYQKDIQNQIFQREDTAVQRRMNDLKAAGLNPNLAAGSSAGAGAVVGRSTTNDIQVGSAIDTINALKQIKLQNRQIQNLQIQNENMLLDQDMKARQDVMQKYDFAVKQAQVFSDLGIPHQSLMYQDDNGNWFPGVVPNTEFNLYDTRVETGKQYQLEEQLSQLKQLGLNIDYSELQNQLSKIDVDFASANYVSKFLSILIKAVK